MKQFTVCLSVVIFLMISCKHKDKLPDTYISRFEKSQEKLDQLVKALKEDTFLENKYGQSFKSIQFNSITKEKLKELGIDEVQLFSWGHK
jgi:hypothetical protein